MDVRVGPWRRLSAKDWCFRTVVLRCLLRVPWTARRSNQSILKETNPEYSFIERTDAEGEAPILWPPDGKSWLSGKYPDAGKDWKQEEKGMTKDEMVGWHHQPNGHEFEQALGVGDGPGGLMWCSPWGRKELETTKRLNWTEKYYLGFPGGSAVKNPPAIEKMQAGDVGSKEMATHSSIHRENYRLTALPEKTREIDR